ncbi:fatty acid desaturase [Acrocarpospora macrocephala]|uniref:Stearoyl-CoA 9-desaturase n=1 Tax=Acrocarpospora macrocephala TaxID=150177 RepID=A0A5M3WXZ3_9ACTN|nr:stearoyl-CoA 9-desaturase [Acrocarpospora macrocephala]
MSAVAGLVPAPRSARYRISMVVLFGALPLIGLAVAVPAAWGWGLGWRDVGIAAVMYTICIFGIGVGFHRLFTHRAFKASRPLRIALAVAGSLAMESPLTSWVSEHRRHHKYADREGDPHSPWRYGEDWKGLAKGLIFAQVGWFIVGAERADPRHYAPDILGDRDLRHFSMRTYAAFGAVSMLLPPLAGGLLSWSWHGALTAFVWGSLVRYALVHHVTWLVNSICHTFGDREFATSDRAGNVRWVALLTFGEGWHNYHHADPTAARHGVLKGQWDASARLIWLFEKFGWAFDVRWPDQQRVSAKRSAAR